MEPVPAAEILARQAYLQETLAAAKIDLALIRQAADLFYYAGVIVDGFLALAPLADPVLFVRRPRHRLQEEELPFAVAYYRDLREIPQLLSQLSLGLGGTLGVELDVMPAALFQRLQGQLFPRHRIVDLSPFIRQQRMIKSDFELEQIRRAARLLDEVLSKAATLLREGMTELELAAALEYELRLGGHQGLVRTRTWNLEMFFGHVLSGVSGLHPAYVDTPSGGPGFSHGFPQGAGRKQLTRNEPVSIDLAACINGYIADCTRLYVLGHLPAPAMDVLALVEHLFQLFSREAKPGVSPAVLYEQLLEEVRHAGWQEYFMGWGQDRVNFIGHGVGLELDELPVIAPRFTQPLHRNVVIAFEPKFFLPELGMLGFEDTGVITPAGVEWLTRSPRQLLEL